MKKFVYAIIIASVLGGAAVNAHAADNFRYVDAQESGVNNYTNRVEDDYYPREQWEKDTITREGRIGEKGYLCVGKDGHICYSYENGEERSEILNDLYEGEQE